MIKRKWASATRGWNPLTFLLGVLAFRGPCCPARSHTFFPVLQRASRVVLERFVQTKNQA